MNIKGSIDKCSENIEDKSGVVMESGRYGFFWSLQREDIYIYKLSPKCCSYQNIEEALKEIKNESLR